MVNGVLSGWKITTHNQTIRKKMMVCISCISNVNQLGSSSHCDVMAQHLQGNRKGFSRAIYGFQDANFFKLNAWDKQRKPARGFSVSPSPKATFVIVLLCGMGSAELVAQKIPVYWRSSVSARVTSPVFIKVIQVRFFLILHEHSWTNTKYLIFKNVLTNLTGG